MNRAVLQRKLDNAVLRGDLAAQSILRGQLNPGREYDTLAHVLDDTREVLVYLPENEADWPPFVFEGRSSTVIALPKRLVPIYSHDARGDLEVIFAAEG